MQLKKSDLPRGVSLVSCSGRLNMITAPQLKAAVEESVGNGTNRLVIDLNGVSFIDSSGLGALISGLKSSRQAGGDLRISATGEQVLTVLQLTNLDHILRPYPTVDDAVGDW